MHNGTVISVNLKYCSSDIAVGTEARRQRKQQSIVDAKALAEGSVQDFKQLETLYNIKKTPQEYIDVCPGGVVNDYHFIPEHILKSPLWDGNMLEVLIWDTNSLNEFNRVLSSNAGPGDIGENILVDDLDVNNLYKGTILSIGESAKLQITGRRSFCFKFVLAFPNTVIHPHTTIDTGKVGIGAKVISPGRIYPGDKITVDQGKTLGPLEYRSPNFLLNKFVNTR